MRANIMLYDIFEKHHKYPDDWPHLYVYFGVWSISRYELNEELAHNYVLIPIYITQNLKSNYMISYMWIQEYEIKY